MNFIQWILNLFRRAPTTENNYQSPYRAPGVKKEPAGPLKKTEKTKHLFSFRNALKSSGVFVIEYFWNFVGAVALFGLLGFVGYFLGFVGYRINSCVEAPPSHTDHCYIQHQNNSICDTDNKQNYFLMAYRTDYQNNFTIGRFDSLNEAVEAAKLINCTIK